MGTYRIAGIVVNANGGAPLDRVDVTIAVAGAERTDAAITTGEDGSFAFDGLRAGKYSVVASRRGFMTAGYEMHEGGFFTAIVTGAGLDSSHLHFQIMPTAMLSGSVIDDAGDPVPGATVTLFRQNSADSHGEAIRMRSNATDDAGGFEFTRLEPGTYFVSASATPWYAFHPQPRDDGDTEHEHPRSPLDVAYPLTFYAGATDSDAATPIALLAGDHPLVNITMHAVPAVHLLMKLPLPPSDAAGPIRRGFSQPSLAQTVFGATENISPTSVNLETVGEETFFEVSGLAPGEYTLEFQGENGRGQGGATEIDLSSDKVLDHSSLTAGAEVNGTVTMAFGAKSPDNLGVTLAPVNRRGRGNGEKVSADGAFTLHDVLPGFYELMVVGGGRQLPVLHIRTAGGEIEGGRLQIGSDPVTLSATVADGSATVSGFVKRNGQALGGTMVVLIPRHPEINRYLFRRDQSNSDGSFSLGRVVPGRYTLIAIEDGWELDWAREGALQKYLAQGKQVVVGAETSTLDLPESLQVQAR